VLQTFILIKIAVAIVVADTVNSFILQLR